MAAEVTEKTATADLESDEVDHDDETIGDDDWRTLGLQLTISKWTIKKPMKIRKRKQLLLKLIMCP